MAQFKRFNASENDNWDSYDTYPAGTLTWDPDNGLRIHDGNNGGGNPVGGNSFSGNYYDLNNRPYGSTAVHDLQGGSSSADDGKFLKQTSIGVSEWIELPTTYNALTIGNITLSAGGTIRDSAGAVAFVSLSTLKQVVADSTDFTDFKSRISSM